MRVSLVLPTLNGGKPLGDVLAAVDRQPGAKDLERIAIDSGSTDGTVERLRDHGFTVDSIDRRTFNHGTTRALAIEKSEGDIMTLFSSNLGNVLWVMLAISLLTPVYLDRRRRKAAAAAEKT